RVVRTMIRDGDPTEDLERDRAKLLVIADQQVAEAHHAAAVVAVAQDPAHPDAVLLHGSEGRPARTAVDRPDTLLGFPARPHLHVLRDLVIRLISLRATRQPCRCSDDSSETLDTWRSTPRARAHLTHRQSNEKLET